MTAHRTVSTVPGLPLLGHALALFRDPCAFLDSLPGEDAVTQIRLGPFTVLLVRDPGLIGQVLRDDRTFDKGGPVFDNNRSWAGNGLPICSHRDHRRQRRLIQPAFHPLRLREYTHVMTAQATALAASWREGRILDIPAEMLRLTSDTLLETLFSDALSSRLRHEAMADITTVMRGTLRHAVLPPTLAALPLPSHRRFRRAHTRLRRTVHDLITDRRTTSGGRDDLLAALLTSRDPGGGEEHLSEAEVADQIVAFFLAATDTPANILAWALHFLTCHPELEDALHEEVDRVLAGSAVAPEHLPQLELTSRIVTETLRRRPPLLLTRTVTVDTQLGDHHVAEGTSVAYSPYLIHHRSDLYPQPHCFDPGRWDPTRPQPRREAFIPFGTGARKCIGDQFATLQITAALAAITARWRLQPVPGNQLQPAVAVALRPRRLHLRAIARNPPHRPGSEQDGPAVTLAQGFVRARDHHPPRGVLQPAAPRCLAPGAVEHAT
ncbi:cytochrome P450 [Micromonospora sp. NPDC023814]|uniref:cytochrome P450 n=1 Tax=Micromonospora sp. NPDC023814 TaxID=3154596 RepID=UPI0033F24DBD